MHQEPSRTSNSTQKAVCQVVKCEDYYNIGPRLILSQSNAIASNQVSHFHTQPQQQQQSLHFTAIARRRQIAKYAKRSRPRSCPSAA